MRPKDRYAAIAAVAEQDLSIQIACPVLGMSECCYDWRSRSARSIRPAWLTDQIRAVHAASRGIEGARRVHAVLVLGRGSDVGHNALEPLMRCAGLKGAIGRPESRLLKPDQIATDLINRNFSADWPNRKWLTDITELHSREGKVMSRLDRSCAGKVCRDVEQFASYSAVRHQTGGPVGHLVPHIINYPALAREAARCRAETGRPARRNRHSARRAVDADRAPLQGALVPGCR